MKVLLAITAEPAVRESLTAAIPDTDVLIIEPEVQRAARRLVSLRADVVLFDDGQGVDASDIGGIRAVAPSTPIMALSARGDAVTQAELRSAGVDAVLTKPFSCDALNRELTALSQQNGVHAAPARRGEALEAGDKRILDQHRMALRWLSRSSLFANDATRLAERLVESVVDIFDVARAVILLEAGGRVRVAASQGIADSSLGGRGFSFSAGIMRWFDAHVALLELATPERARDVRMAVLAENAVKELRVLHGEIAVPLLREGLAVGAIVLGEKTSGAPYTAEERELLTLLARGTSINFAAGAAHGEADRQRGAVEEILQKMDAGIVVVDATQRIRVLNPRAAKMLGLPDEGVEGRGLEKLSDFLSALFVRAIEDGLPNAEQHVSEAAARFDVSVQPLEDGGALALLVAPAGTSLDVGEITYSPFWEYLSARVAQEVKNPMVAINTFAQLLPSKYESEEFRDAFSRVVQKEVARINHVVETLFAFARSPQPILRLSRLNDVVQDVLQSFEDRLAARAIDVETHWDPAVEQAELDAVFFAQALHNILQNSIEAMPAGGKLSITTRRQNGHAEIDISDTGPGVPEDEAEQIFLPFYSTKETGMGLGLPLARRILQQHRGALKLAPSENGGSRFTIQLPAAAAQEK